MLMLIKMPYKKIIQSVLILTLILCIPQLSCKKQSTTPIIDDLTRPVIWLNQFSISFSASETGPNPSSQILQIKNSGQQTLEYTLSSDADWVKFSPDSGISTGQMNKHTISINKAGLEAQDEEYTAKITVTSSQAYNNPQEVNVSLSLSKEPPPKIWVSTNNLTFSAQQGGANPPSQTIKIKNSGEGTLRYDISTDVSWLDINPSSGNSETQERSHSVLIDIAGLNVGTYDGTITITDSNATNSPQNVSVSLDISKEPPPEIWLSRDRLTFGATLGGPNPSSRDFFVNNSGGGKLSYDITSDASWLSVSPSSGQTTDSQRRHTASVNISGLGIGTYRGTLTITDPSASNSPQEINVILNITGVLDDNEVGIKISPNSGGTGTIVTLTVFIKGNTSPIASAFGLNLNYDASIFQYQSTSKGTLTNSWAAVDGGASGGTVTVGGFRGSGSVISTGSQGSIAVVRFKVIHSGSSLSRQFTMTNIIDDLVGMTIRPGTVTFIYP
jgi:hypothetical protein